MALVLFALGVLLWTFAEYLMHRGAHWINEVCPHHVKPLDYSIGPSWAFIALAFGIAWFVWPSWAMAGFTFGYCLYALAHWAMHHRSGWFYIGPRWLAALRVCHVLHHYRFEDSNFGVTSPLWDKLFGTYRVS